MISINKRYTNVCLPDKLLICITFYYVKERLYLLKNISKDFSSLGNYVSVCIATNTFDSNELAEIHTLMKFTNVDQYEIVTPEYLGHPYLLTWIHLGIFRKYFTDHTYSHFLYMEDDIRITIKNVMYWQFSRELLRPYGLVPGFVRFEYKKHNSDLYATDFVSHVNFYTMPKVNYINNYTFMNLSNAYQACYLMDRELMEEHLLGDSSNPDFGRWDIRARAAAGLTFFSVPEGFLSRNVVGVQMPSMQIDEDALIHHTANNYANDEGAPNAKILIPELIKSDYYCYLRFILKKISIKNLRKIFTT